MNRVVGHNLRFQSSYRSMESMAKIVNSTPGASVKIPERKYGIKKFMKSKFDYERHIKCSRCSNYIASYENTAQCEICDKELNGMHSDYFFNIPIEQQLVQSIQNHIDEILLYDSTIS